MGWNRKEEMGNKYFKKEEQAGSRNEFIKRGGGRWRSLTNYVYKNLKVYDFVNWLYKNLNQCIIMSL